MIIQDLTDLNDVISVVEDFEVPKTRYMLDIECNGDIYARAYNMGKEIPDEDIFLGAIIADNFDEFFEELKCYFRKNTKLSISKDYALVLLASFNGGEPEDYDEY